jgi:hypothetical protein
VNQVVALMKRTFSLNDQQAWAMVDWEYKIAKGSKTPGSTRPGRADIVFSTDGFAGSLGLPKVTFIWELKSDGPGRQSEAAMEVQHYIRAYTAAHKDHPGFVLPGLPIDPATVSLGSGKLKVYSPNRSTATPDGAILYGRDNSQVRNPIRIPDLSPDLGGAGGMAAILAAIWAAGRRGGGVGPPVREPGLAVP